MQKPMKVIKLSWASFFFHTTILINRQFTTLTLRGGVHKGIPQENKNKNLRG
jgi:hypothetical protein